MKFLPQKIPGVFVIEPTPFTDNRGMFRRHFCAKEFEAAGIDMKIVQCNVSENNFKHTMRGFHYQADPHGEGKTISCFRGAIYDVVIDLRPNSPTYFQWVAQEISESNRLSIHLPAGCANAFLTLEDNTIVHYYFNEYYYPGFERGFRYNDPLFKVQWPFEPKVISDRDLAFPDFKPENK